jgi:hypothetical protein
VAEDLGEHGFPSEAHLSIDAHGYEAAGGAVSGAEGGAGLDITVTPLAFGPVLLVNDIDGRVSRFPRAMVRYQAGDGRKGFGWIEWNQPQGGA